MRALVPLLLLAIVQKSSCDDMRNYTDIMFDIFGPPVKSNGTSNTKEDSSEELEKGVEPCGLIRDGTAARGLRIEKRITTNGTRARYTDYPWMVALFRRRTDIPKCTPKTKRCWRYVAGGSLINMKVLLTAAHSVSGVAKNNLKARAGDWDLKSKDEMFPYQERIVNKIIIHNRHKDSNNANEMEYDAALLIVADPFKEADNVATICLPPPDLVHSENCRTSGWGKKKHGSAASNQKILKVVDLEPVRRDRCERALSRAVNLEVTLHESCMCAGGVAGKDSCQGDGGSPLMCIKHDYYYQRGIVSWGIGCGEADLPGVYTDVAKVRNWIDDQMQVNGFDPRTYIYVPEADPQLYDDI